MSARSGGNEYEVHLGRRDIAGVAPRAMFHRMEQNEPRTTPLTKTAKLDATTEAAYEIIDQQALDREKKTARLRALRLASEKEKLPAAVRRKGAVVG